MSEPPGDRLRQLMATPWVRSRVLVHLAPSLPAEALTPRPMPLARSAAGGERLADPAVAAIAARALELAEATGSSRSRRGCSRACRTSCCRVRSRWPARARTSTARRARPRAAQAGDAGSALTLLEEAAASAGPETVRYELEEIAPRVGPEQAGRALDLALRMPYFWAWLETVAALAPALSFQEAEPAIQAVRPLTTDDRLPVLAALVPRLDRGPPPRASTCGRCWPGCRRAGPTGRHDPGPRPARAGAPRRAEPRAPRGARRRRQPIGGSGALPVMESLIGLAAIAGPALGSVASLALRHAETLAPWAQAPMVVRLASVLPQGELRQARSRWPQPCAGRGEPWRVFADLAELVPEAERAGAEHAAPGGGIRRDRRRRPARGDDRGLRAPAAPEAPPEPGRAGADGDGDGGRDRRRDPAGRPAAVFSEAFYAYAGAPPAMAPPVEQPAAAPPTQEPDEDRLEEWRDGAPEPPSRLSAASHGRA